jgi:hypothetical protein
MLALELGDLVAGHDGVEDVLGDVAREGLAALLERAQLAVHAHGRRRRHLEMQVGPLGLHEAVQRGVDVEHRRPGGSTGLPRSVMKTGRSLDGEARHRAAPGGAVRAS